jgi:hypothetical protein
MVKLADPQDQRHEVRSHILAADEIEIVKHIKANHVIFVKAGEGISRSIHFQKMVTARNSINGSARY